MSISKTDDEREADLRKWAEEWCQSAGLDATDLTFLLARLDAARARAAALEAGLRQLLAAHDCARYACESCNAARRLLGEKVPR